MRGSGGDWSGRGWLGWGGMALFWRVVIVLVAWAFRVSVDRERGDRDPSEATLRRRFAVGESGEAGFAPCRRVLGRETVDQRRRAPGLHRPHAGSTSGALLSGWGCEACPPCVAGPPERPRPRQERGSGVNPPYSQACAWCRCRIDRNNGGGREHGTQ